MAGAVVQTNFGSGHVRDLVLACTADSVNGSLPDTFLDLSAIVGGARLVDLTVDPGASTSPSVSASASTSPSLSASASVSPSMSVSISASRSASASASPSGSLSASASASASRSPSVSASASSSASRSPSASISPTVSASASASPSLSPSASVSPSSSLSPSASASPSVATPETDLDIQVFDAHGIDVLQGVGMNSGRVATTRTPIVYSGTSLHPLVSGRDALRLHVAATSASAQFTLRRRFALGY
jgi:hypothetical protein